MPRKPPSKTVTFRVDRALDSELDRQAARRGSSRTQLLTRYLDEGMRMDAHPGIVFREGPAGRRAAVIGGPDVWEIARVLRESKASGEGAIAETAKAIDVAPALVEVATRYYADFRAEVDAWIARVDEEAETAREAWSRRNEILA